MAEEGTTVASPLEKLAEMYDYKEHEERIDTLQPEVETIPAEMQGASTDEEPQPEPEEKQEEGNTDDTKEEIPTALLDRAMAVGLRPADVAGFSTNSDLDSAIRLLESMRPNSATPQAEEQEAVDPLEALSKEFSLDLDKDDVDGDSLVSAIQQLAKHQAEQNRAVVGYVQQAAQQLQQQVQGNEALSWFDAKLASLGPEWSEVLGSGPTKALPAGSEELARRNKLIGSMTGMGSTRPDLTEDQALNLGLQEFAGLLKQKPHAQKAVLRPNRGLPGAPDPEVPFARVKALYDQFTRENGDK